MQADSAFVTPPHISHHPPTTPKSPHFHREAGLEDFRPDLYPYTAMSLGLAYESQFRGAGQPCRPPSSAAYVRIQDHLLSHGSPEAQVRQGRYG